MNYLQLADVVLLGRTFDEYCQIFKLDNETLRAGAILDAAGGVSSFCTEANARGYSVTAADRIYSFEPDEIERKCSRDLDHVMGQLPSIAERYIWDFYKDVDGLRAHRERAYQAFVEDFRRYGRERYIPTTLPATSFADAQFRLALSSHLLFLYDDQLDYSFHKQTILELLRVVSHEVRIFPLVNLRNERGSALARLFEDADLQRYFMQIEPVNYEFIKNGNEMLVIRHPNR
jgi:hypothetical protein